MSKAAHTWPPFFAEMASVIAEKHDSDSLLAVLRDAQQAGLKTVSTVDREQDEQVPLEAIDPFTFFASINRNMTVPNRQALCSYFADVFGLQSPRPDEFDGVPVVDHTSAWFFPYRDKRDPGDVPALWKLFREAVTGGPDAVDGATFARCLEIHKVAQAKLTMGLFWVRPAAFLPLDRRTTAILAKAGIEVPKKIDWAGYRELLDRVSREVGDDYVALSADAYAVTSGQSDGGTPGGAKPTTVDAAPKGTRATRPSAGGSIDVHGVVGAPTSTNLILYGPPGTGKTYSTAARALMLIDPRLPEGHTRVKDRYRQLSAEGRIGVVTFHQAYGYEEFVEGIRPVLGADTSGDVRYELHEGAFKRMALLAARHGVLAQPTDVPFDVLWEKLLERVDDGDAEPVPSARGRTYQLEVAPSRRAITAYPAHRVPEGDWVVERDRMQSASLENLRLWWEHRDELGPDPESITYEKASAVIGRARGNAGGHHYSPTWVCYRMLLEIDTEMRSASVDRLPTRAETQARLDDPTFEFRFEPDAPQYVLVIDEINRGNISKILGELITLLEPDKRLGAANELRLPLAYSPGRRFGVPPNLHIVGTMNTADRSIALMDVALRRRFRFEEMMPEPGVVRSVLAGDGVPEALVALVVEVFETINRRIRFLYDRDHQLGHSMFLGVRSLADLRDVCRETVVPLLQEYFYGAWDKVAIVLGCPYDEDGRPLRSGARVVGDRYRAPLLERTVVDEVATLGFDHDDYESVVEVDVAPAFARGDDPTFLATAFVDMLDNADDARIAAVVATSG